MLLLVFPAVLLHQAHRTLADFGRELVGLIHGFIILRVEASTKPGAVHSVDAIDSQLRKIEGQSLGYKVARFFGLLGR